MSKLIYWMLVDSDLSPPQVQGVLSPSELIKFSAFRFPKRQKEWLQGRWAAKALAHSLPAYRDTPLDQIEILNTPEGAPFLQVQGQAPRADCLTISHSGHLALCALASGSGFRVGADLEKIEPRTGTFILDYFTPAECQLVETVSAENRAVVVTLIWSAKEAMLKALGVGLRWDTRMVEVRAVGDILQTSRMDGKWKKIEIGETKAGERIWNCWWRRREQFILTLAGFSTSQAGLRSARLVEKKP